jgi:hypothetical protein
MNPRNSSSGGCVGVFSFRATLVVAAVIVALALPATAAAQGGDATAAEYKATDKLVVGAAGGGGGGGPEQPSGLETRVVSGLPFTGFDLLAMGLAAVVITGTGFALRGLSSAPRLEK